MGNINIIVIIAGGLAKNSAGGWHSPTFEEGLAFYGAPGSRERVVAASFLWKENPDAFIAVLGGKGQMKDIPDAPTLAEAISQELVELGVPREKIIEEKESGTTYQQLLALQKISLEHSPEKIIIVSNKYHLPRVEAMVDCAPELLELKRFNKQFQPAEEVLIKHEPDKWKESVDRAYALPEMKELIKKENHGVKQIREGTYRW